MYAFGSESTLPQDQVAKGIGAQTTKRSGEGGLKHAWQPIAQHDETPHMVSRKGQNGQNLQALSEHLPASKGGALGRGNSDRSAVLLKQGNHVSHSPGVELGGVELMSELNKIASSLLLSSASRSSSFLICSSSFLICRILCSIAYCRTFRSTVGLQLSFCNSRRQGGSDARNSCLLR